MDLHFHKYQGTGNDFIILDNRTGEYSNLNTQQINFLCNRRFGIGADGLMLLNAKAGYDFEMKYYNADGRESSMCGNGGRCLVKFAYHLGIHKNTYLFSAIDGDHEAEIDLDGTVSLKMKDVNEIRHVNGDYILDTGSPHYIKMVSDLDKFDVFKNGRAIRNSDLFKKENSLGAGRGVGSEIQIFSIFPRTSIIKFSTVPTWSLENSFVTRFATTAFSDKQ